jgi:hypothetical protein
MRSKLVQGTNSITCEKRVRPEYMTVPRLKSPNRVRNYRQNPKRCSSRHQKKHQRNPYIAASFCKITLAEPDSTDLSYVSTILQPGEHILSVGRLHWIIYAEPAVAFALSIGCFFAAKFAALEPLFGEVSGLILLAASMLLFAKAWFDQWIPEIAVKERGGSGLAAELVASAWPPQQVASKADAA